MKTLAGLPPGNVTALDVLTWVHTQAQYLPGPSHVAVLYHLATYAFWRDDNPEGVAVGQVMYHASYYTAIMAGTGIKTKATIVRVMDDLERMGYIDRTLRENRGPSSPLEICVLWHCPGLQKAIREDGLVREPRPKASWVDKQVALTQAPQSSGADRRVTLTLVPSLEVQ